MLTYSMPSLKASLVRLHIGSGAHGRQAELGIGAGSLRKMAVSRWNCTLEHVGWPGNIWQLQISSLKMPGVINLYKMKIRCWEYSTYLNHSIPILPVSSYLILSLYFTSGFFKSFLLVRYRALLPSSTLESSATPADRMSQPVQAAPRFFQAMLVTRQLDCLQVFPF